MEFHQVPDRCKWQSREEIRPYNQARGAGKGYCQTIGKKVIGMIEIISVLF
jgi:hypothetical protein